VVFDSATKIEHSLEIRQITCLQALDFLLYHEYSTCQGHLVLGLISINIRRKRRGETEKYKATHRPRQDIHTHLRVHFACSRT
jgi:hypothetical protein